MNTFILNYWFYVKCQMFSDYTNLFPAIDYEKNDQNNDKIFCTAKKMKNLSYSEIGIENLKNLQYYTFYKKH